MISRRASSSASACTRGVSVAVWFVLIAVLLCTSPAFALDVPPLDGHVNDHAGLLTATDRAALERKLSGYELQTGHQFALLAVPTLAGEPIEHFGIRVAERWQLGSEKHDDGLVLLVARNDRKMRIEVGHGLEGAIPDVVAARIIRELLAPAFQRGQFLQGLDAAFSRLMGLGRAEAPRAAPARPERSAQRKRSDALALGWLLLVGLGVCFVLGVVLAEVEKRRGPRRGTRDPIPPDDAPRARGAPTDPPPPHRIPSSPPGRPADPVSALALSALTRRDHRKPSDSEPADDWFTSNSSRSDFTGSSDSRRDSDENMSGGGGAFGGGGASGSW